jgi:trigger factor
VTVSKEIERLEHSAIKLTLTIPKDDVHAEYDAMLADLCKTIQLPGFRRGKVPKDVLQRKFADTLKGDALSKIIEKVLTKVFGAEAEGVEVSEADKADRIAPEDRPLPYSSPSLQGEPKLDLDADLTFAVIYDVMPKLAVETRQGLEVEIPECAISDEDIKGELEAVRERNAVVLDKDDGAQAASGDVVTVNFCERTDSGEEVAGTAREDFVFTLGTKANVYEFDDNITGMTKNETREFEKTFAGDFPDKEQAGKTLKLRVTLTALKERKLPDLDDELAQDVDEKYATLQDLQDDIKKRLNRTLENRLRGLKIDAILEKIMASTPVDLPESMIRIQLDARYRQLGRQFGIPTEQIREIWEKDDNDEHKKLTVKWHDEAAKALHSRLIVEKLLDELKFEVSDDDKQKEYEDIAGENGVSVDEIKKHYDVEHGEEELAGMIKERKLYDLLFAENTIKTGSKVSFTDLMKENR